MPDRSKASPSRVGIVFEEGAEPDAPTATAADADPGLPPDAPTVAQIEALLVAGQHPTPPIRGSAGLLAQPAPGDAVTLPDFLDEHPTYAAEIPLRFRADLPPQTPDDDAEAAALEIGRQVLARLNHGPESRLRPTTAAPEPRRRTLADVTDAELRDAVQGLLAALGLHGDELSPLPTPRPPWPDRAAATPTALPAPDWGTWQPYPRPECRQLRCQLTMSYDAVDGAVSFRHVWGSQVHVFHVGQQEWDLQEGEGQEMLIKKQLFDFHERP